MELDRELERFDTETKDYIQQLKEYLEGSNNSPERYGAFCDFHNLESLKLSQQNIIENQIRESDPEKKLRIESHLRITEFRIALLEHEQEQKKNKKSRL